MFTKKPERDPATDAFQRTAERPAGEATAFTDRPLASAKRPSSGKLVPSIIGEDLTIVGNVTSKGEIQVDGQIQGDVNCGSLLLGDKSQITGGVTAEDVVVRGHVMGAIRGLRVTLQSQSHVEGDIYHQSLAIEQGAYFEGKSRRSDNPLAEPKSAAEAASKDVRLDASVRAAE
jgi:cytoskeletal protein CcmA (bactofilin family)